MLVPCQRSGCIENGNGSVSIANDYASLYISCAATSSSTRLTAICSNVCLRSRTQRRRPSPAPSRLLRALAALAASLFLPRHERMSHNAFPSIRLCVCPSVYRLAQPFCLCRLRTCARALSLRSARALPTLWAALSTPTALSLSLRNTPTTVSLCPAQVCFRLFAFTGTF